MTIRESLGLTHVYDDVLVDDHTVDLQGWVSDAFDAVFADILEEIPDGALVVEVGTWKGASVIKMADAIKAADKSLQILCIDTWLGSPEFYFASGINCPTRGEGLQRKNGFPTVYNTFLRNVKKLGHADIVTPFPLSSVQAADVLAHYNTKAFCIYIDASHEHEAVLADLNAYWPLVQEGGVAFGDDWQWPGVKSAVERFAQDNGLTFETFGEGQPLWKIKKV